MNNVLECVDMLDQIMLTGDHFDYELARQRIEFKKTQGEITLLEYSNLVDACEHRNRDGHYRNSLIYKRAVTEDQKAE